MDKTQGGFLISRAKQLGGRVFERLLKEKGVDEFNGAQGRILYVLWEHGTLNITQIGRQTSLAKKTLTGMLGRMESSELIEKKQDGKNKRQILVSLTDKAAKLSRDYEEISERMNGIFYGGFTDGEITAFELKLKRIISNLSQYERME